MKSTSPAVRLTLCGSLSLHPVSLGAAMHLAAYRALELAFTYVPFKVSDLRGAITGMRALGIRGFGISMPFKQEVIALVDALDPLAARIAAVNTVVNEEGTLTGHNTDAFGAVRALEEAVGAGALRGKRTLMLGTGGAGRAVAFGLVDAGAEVVIAGRDGEKTEALAAACGAKAAGFEESARARDYAIVVNATSMGMLEVDPASPVPTEALCEGLVVMDIVYKPVKTRLVRAAEERGARVIHGGRMLLWQAARQFELYTGHSAPIEAMNAALMEQIAEGDSADKLM